MAFILNGRARAVHIKEEVRNEIKKLGITPGLVAILVGNDPASHLYVTLKEKACAEVGIQFEKYIFPATVPQKMVIDKIRELNTRADIHAILVQVPLPPPLEEDAVIRAIDPTKDVDGFHPENLELLIAGTPKIIPGVALGIFELIKLSNVSLPHKRAVLLVNSTTFAAPIEYLLESAGALCHIILAPTDITTVQNQTKTADILVVAIGRARAITADMIKEGAVVIDVGTNRLPDDTVCGDVDFESVKEKTGAITPVPGGVGPMTVAMLLQNVLRLPNKLPHPSLSLEGRE